MYDERLNDKMDDTKPDVAASAVERLVMLKREYIEAIQPFIKIKAQIYSRNLPTITVHENGEVEHKYNFTDAEDRTLKQIEENIEYIGKRILNA